jgi:hypothetical protein
VRVGRSHAWAPLALALLAAACGEGEPAPPAATGAAAVVPDAPPGTDIWLARLVRGADGSLAVEDPVNVTRRQGYDNQPSFLPDGTAFRYTMTDSAGQADIWLHEIEGGANRAVTSTTPESEYSATPLPSGVGFSAIRVEADSTQRLWRFDDDGGGAAVLFPDIAPVGYHAWADDSTAVLYVLGEPATLQVARLGVAGARTVATDVGRSLQRIPGTSEVSYVQRLDGGATEIRRLDPASGSSERIAAGVEGGDFHAWTPDGVLLQAYEGKLFAFRPGAGTEWEEVADLSALGVRLSRIAVHPDGSWIALVGEETGGG